MKRSFCILFTFLLFASGCWKKSEPQTPTSQFPSDGTGLPLPRFDTDFDQLLVSMEQEFNADAVRISRPFEFNSENKPEYWLKVSLLNPQISQVGSDPFGLFAQRVAQTTYRHLTNADRFNKIEISVEQDSEDILGFNSVISKFLWRDSLRSDAVRDELACCHGPVIDDQRLRMTSILRFRLLKVNN